MTEVNIPDNPEDQTPLPEGNSNLADSLFHNALVDNAEERLKKANAALKRGSTSDAEEHILKGLDSLKNAMLNPFSSRLTAEENARYKFLTNLRFRAEPNGIISERSITEGQWNELQRLDRKARGWPEEEV